MRTLAALTLLLVLVPTLVGAEEASMADAVLFEFPEQGELWPSIDDPVMGGRSRSRMHAVDRIAVFEGVVSLENNGGFCSVRSQPERRDLSASDGLRLLVNSDGRRYAFRLRTDDRWDGVSYEVKFEAPAGEWTWVELAFTDFVPVYRGRRVADWPPLDPQQLFSFGLLIADGQEGEFRLEIRSIEAFSRKTAP